MFRVVSLPRTPGISRTVVVLLSVSLCLVILEQIIIAAPAHMGAAGFTPRLPGPTYSDPCSGGAPLPC